MKDILTLVIALTVIAAIAGLGLSMVFTVTEEPIRQADLKKIRDSITAVLPPFANSPDDKETNPDWNIVGDYEYFLARDEDGTILGLAFVAVAKEGYGGGIETMLGITCSGEIVRIKNLKHRETPGLGSKIKEAWFKEQFTGASLKNRTIYVKKDDKGTTELPAFDAITGATISCRAVTDSIRKALEHFEENREKIISKDSRVKPGGEQ